VASVSRHTDRPNRRYAHTTYIDLTERSRVTLARSSSLAVSQGRVSIPLVCRKYTGIGAPVHHLLFESGCCVAAAACSSSRNALWRLCQQQAATQDLLAYHFLSSRVLISLLFLYSILHFPQSFNWEADRKINKLHIRCEGNLSLPTTQ
jgi:hypothetical protein